MAKKICGISPPNLSSVWILASFQNPVRQPLIAGVKGGMLSVYQSLLKKNICEAAILRTNFQYKLLTKEQQEALKTLATSKMMPNQGFSVSMRVTIEQKIKIKKSLLVGEGVNSTQGILKRYAGKAKNFLPAEVGEYIGYNDFLEGVIFGW